MKRNTVATFLGAAVLVSVGLILLVHFIQRDDDRRENTHTPESTPPQRRPNIILFLADGMGYGDLRTYGHPTQEPNEIDQMAREGMLFTQWTSPDSASSASRAAMLTGRYAIRSGIYGGYRDFQHNSTGGIRQEELTIAESLKELGYSTGMVGKWQLGVNERDSTDGVHLPVHHGFDYIGRNLPYVHPWCGDDAFVRSTAKYCYLYDNNTIVEQPVDLTALTGRMVLDVKDFIKQKRDEAFFLYFSFQQTHRELPCSFCEKSQRGTYGDSVADVAWAVGEVLNELKALGIEKDTLVIFTSDRGPIDGTCFDQGDTGSFRGGGYTTWEGGFRVPAIVWWPGTIVAGSTNYDVVNSMDIFQTALHLAGAPDYFQTKNITIDGQAIPGLIDGNASREFFIYYCSDRIMAVRYRQYKIHFLTFGFGEEKISENVEAACEKRTPSESYSCYGEDIIKWDPPLIFNLLSDPSESRNRTAENLGQMLHEVDVLLQQHRATVVNVTSELDKTGAAEINPCCNAPLCSCNLSTPNG